MFRPPMALPLYDLPVDAKVHVTRPAGRRCEEPMGKRETPEHVSKDIRYDGKGFFTLADACL